MRGTEAVMFRKILKKDFKRKKAMNIILFIFMLTASILIAGSTNLLYSTITAVDYFIEKSEVADLISVTGTSEDIRDTITEWTDSSRTVKDYLGEDIILVDEKLVTASPGKPLQNTGTLVIAVKPVKYNLVFNKDGKDFEVGPSQAAVPVSVQKKMGLSVGDSLTIEINGYRKEFTVSCIFKDAVLGAELMGLKRILLNKTDFDILSTHASDAEHLQFWGFSKITGYENKDLQNGFAELSVPTYTIVTKDLVRTTYVLDMVLAAIMIIVSIFLILISFLILRFTIVFTVMEDYKQIGVMKAIGLRDGKIRGIYSLKYLALSVVSGVIGYFASFPVSGLMKKNISEFILLVQSPMNYIISLISVLAVVGITMLFCNYSTGKIKKISAIDAIRQGNTGERFKNTGKLKLSRRKRMGIPLFLACSDIVSDMKKFIILIITFVLGTAIIIIPNNVITTLSSGDMISLFGYSNSDFYVRDGMIGNQQAAIDRIEELNAKFREVEISAQLRADLITNGKVFTMDKSESVSMLGLQGIEISPEQYDYLGGVAPILANEIAVTEKIAKTLDISIGDSIYCELEGECREYIVTGLFQSYNNLGNSVRLPESYRAESGGSTSVTISGLLSGTDKEKDGQFLKLKEAFPELSIKNNNEVVKSFIGDIIKQIGAVENLILIIVGGINFLITALLLRMLISKEIPDIAILKSMGVPTLSIKLWQIFRIGIVLAVSILLGTLLANTTGSFLTAGIFSVMGVTRLKLLVEPLQVYLICPALVFAVTMLAVLCSLGQIKRTKVWELNNQE